ncbi:MAG: hypothetical protein IKS55_14800 [Oscillospiraceae bacterium]|nr:hypothetical protein [Oscillospiraceae bacterium]
MNQKEYQRRMAYEALILLLLLALLLFITRLWPILLLVILGIFIATLRLLFLSSRNVPPTQPPVLLPPRKTDIKAQTAYCALIEDINAGIFQSYPDARWIWESPGALRDLEAGKPAIILLNRAGGYRRAELRAEHGRLKSLVYLSAPVSPPKSSDTHADSQSSASEPLPENYELVAFEWVEANMVSLNQRINDSIGSGETGLHIDRNDLPKPESWSCVCKELQRNGLQNVKIDADGIKVLF